MIVLPQAFRAVVPPLFSILIALLKNTTIAAGFSVAEAGAIRANLAELGYPAEVSARAPAAGAGGARGTAGMIPQWAGRAGRLAAALGGLAATRSSPARLEVDHTAVDLRLAGLVVANGQFSMGRMKVAPRALPDDGRLSVMAFQGEPLGIYARSKDLYYGLHVPTPRSASTSRAASASTPPSRWPWSWTAAGPPAAPR